MIFFKQTVYSFILIGFVGLSLTGRAKSRCQSTDSSLVISFPQTGTIKDRDATKISSSMWSIGGETLDRDFTDYDKYKSYLGPLGAKRIRIQAGWAKTENVKGIYNWKWLDNIINDAVSRGVKPWVNISYGNPIYAGGGKAAIGYSPPSSAEALAAWDYWVSATVKRYKNKVNEWEIWNEPDHRSNPLPIEQYSLFYIRTAEIIRKEQPASNIVALAMCELESDWYKQFLAYLKDHNKLSLVDIISYHGYPTRPEDLNEKIKAVRDGVNQYSGSIKLWQGESGCSSTSNTSGSMRNAEWTEVEQAKWIMRRMLDDLGHDVTVSSIFQISDMNGYSGGKTNTKGLLKTNADKSIAYAKPSYYAMMHVTSIFDDRVKRIQGFTLEEGTDESLTYYGYETKNNVKIITLWIKSKKPTNDFVTHPVNFTVKNAGFKKPVYIDLYSGKIYSIPQANWKRSGNDIIFTAIPVYDSPLLITDASL
jgi:hypothetical protein